MAKITHPNLPADLPENWNNSQYVSADGAVAGLTPKHGYNYLMQQVNNAQKAVNTLAQQAQTGLTDLEKGESNATAQRTGTTVAITGPEGASTVTFLAPSNWVAGDTYTYNGQMITLTDLNGNPVKNGWKQGAPVTLSISGSTAYFAAGASGDFLPLEGGTMTGPAVGAPGAIATPQFRNIQYGAEQLVEGVSELPEGTLYITPEDDGGSALPSGNFKLVQTNENFDVYASDDGFAILVGKKLKMPTRLNGVSNNNGYYTWGQSFDYTDLSNPEYTIKEEYRVKNGTDPYVFTGKSLHTYFHSSGSVSRGFVQIVTADIATNQQGYFLCTYRVCNPTEFEILPIEDLIKKLNAGMPNYLMYRYK